MARRRLLRLSRSVTDPRTIIFRAQQSLLEVTVRHPETTTARRRNPANQITPATRVENPLGGAGPLRRLANTPSAPKAAVSTHYWLFILAAQSPRLLR